MGRYYSGDIEGKFWFGVQSSDDPSFFGGEQFEPNHINYHFTEEDLPQVQKGIGECEKELGKFKVELDKFFEKNDSYNSEMLEKALGQSKDKISDLLEWYARLELGVKIRDCIKANGACSFEAEL